MGEESYLEHWDFYSFLSSQFPQYFWGSWEKTGCSTTSEQNGVTGMELELVIRKRKPWDPKWKIRKPTLYLLYYRKEKLFNSFWWAGNWKSDGIRFNGSAKAVISRRLLYLNYMVVGNTGTDLIIREKGKEKIIKGHKGNIPGFTIFGKINTSLGVFEKDVKTCEKL